MRYKLLFAFVTTLSITACGSGNDDTGPVDEIDPITHVPTEFEAGAVTLSFDDGWRSQYINAQPLLTQYGYKGTFYIHTDGMNGGWDGYMDQPMVRSLAEAGHEIGNHSISHAHLPELSDTDRWAEISRPKLELAVLTGQPINSLAYPYGEYNQIVIDDTWLAEHTNGRAAGGLVNGFNTLDQPLYEIGSFSPTKFDPLAYILLALDEARQSNQWFVFSFHQIGEDPENEFNTSVADFIAILDHLKQNDFRVITIEEGANILNRN